MTKEDVAIIAREALDEKTGSYCSEEARQVRPYEAEGPLLEMRSGGSTRWGLPGGRARRV